MYFKVDTLDIGRSGAACLASSNIEQHHGKYYEMNGPVELRGTEIARIFSNVLGRDIKFVPLDIDTARSKMPKALSEIYDYLMENPEHPLPFNDDIKNLTGQQSHLEQFLQRHKSKFI